MSGQAAPVKVLFVGSWSRSGSTLLDLLLGRLDGFFSAGELRLLWQRGAAEDQLCGCERRFSECGLWQGVVERTFGHPGPLRGEELAAVGRLARAMDHLALVPWLAAGGEARQLTEHRRLLGRLYRAVQEESGCRWVVDSSKAASYGLILQGAPGVELHAVHLVRDSRAVAHSWQRRKKLPEVHWKEAYMPTFRPGRSALFWSLENLALELLRPRAASFTRLRYEDLARDPQAALARVLARIGETEASRRLSSETAEAIVELGTNHTVAGNPLRFRRGAVEVRPDAEWRSRLPRSQAATVTALTWPLLARYGYLGRPGRPGATREPLPV